MKKKKIISLVPMFLICIVPALVFLNIVKTELSIYDWFSANDTEYDFFLICKSYAVVLAALMMLAIISEKVFSNSKMKLTAEYVILIPVAVYAVCALVSSVYADGKSDRISGGYAQHESAVILCSYAVIFMYIFLKIKSDAVSYYIKKIFVFVLICAGILSFVGVTQFFSCDVIVNDVVKKVITFGSGLDSSRISLSFPEKTVYMTLYNPNYVGSFVCLVLPVVAAVFMIWKSKLVRGMSAAVIVMLIISLIGSGSQAGMTGLVCEVFIVICIFFIKKTDKKNVKICAGVLGTLIMVLICAGMVFAVSEKNDEKAVNKLTEISISENEVKAVISGETVNIDSPAVCEDYSVISARSPEGFEGLKLICDGNEYFFTNDNSQGKYLYRNAYGKYTDDFYNSGQGESFIPEGFASGRGYIWNRTFPLIKDNLFVGCGPDNFVYEFPNNDYVGMTNNGYAGKVVTRPHNMYLQMDVQTGLISLVAFLVLYVLYFISSIAVLKKYKNVATECVICTALYTAVSGYMLCGLANDSTVCVAPLFWLIMAAGCGYNNFLNNKL